MPGNDERKFRTNMKRNENKSTVWRQVTTPLPSTVLHLWKTFRHKSNCPHHPGMIQDDLDCYYLLKQAQNNGFEQLQLKGVQYFITITVLYYMHLYL